jgi:hypothetical protein
MREWLKKAARVQRSRSTYMVICGAAGAHALDGRLLHAVGLLAVHALLCVACGFLVGSEGAAAAV